MRGLFVAGSCVVLLCAAGFSGLVLLASVALTDPEARSAPEYPCGCGGDCRCCSKCCR